MYVMQAMSPIHCKGWCSRISKLMQVQNYDAAEFTPLATDLCTHKFRLSPWVPILSPQPVSERDVYYTYGLVYTQLTLYTRICIHLIIHNGGVVVLSEELVPDIIVDIFNGFLSPVVIFNMIITLMEVIILRIFAAIFRPFGIGSILLCIIWVTSSNKCHEKTRYQVPQTLFGTSGVRAHWGSFLRQWSVS